jgi:hypothetical protein
MSNTYIYGEKLSDQAIDNFCKRITEEHSNQNEDSKAAYVNSAISSNGGKLPIRIRTLLENLK